MKKLHLLKGIAMLFVLSTCLVQQSCTKTETETITKEVQIEKTYKTPKYVFLFVGDGMGQVQLNAARIAALSPSFNPTTSKSFSPLNINKLKVSGVATTYAEDRYVTGSAAAATAFATGHKTSVGTISMNSNHSENLKTIAEMARDKGMKVGIVSSVSIDHATPACFYAHQSSRSNYSGIAKQMSTSGFDYFAGGYTKSKESVIDLMKSKGYKISTNRNELESSTKDSKHWAYTNYDASSAMYYEIDRPAAHVSLEEFTQKGIELLDNEKGFFMMVEGGKIDWACHGNDAASAIIDLLAFDRSVGKAIDFYNQHPDETLIIVTGDHECGGLSIGFTATSYAISLDLLKYQKLSFDMFSEKVESWVGKDFSFEQALASVKEDFGLGNESLNKLLKLSDYETSKLKTAFEKSMKRDLITNIDKSYEYSYYDPFTVTVTHILNNKAGLGWSSFNHSGVPVPVFALGEGDAEFNGQYDNTDIAKKIITVAKLN